MIPRIGETYEPVQCERGINYKRKCHYSPNEQACLLGNHGLRGFSRGLVYKQGHIH